MNRVCSLAKQFITRQRQQYIFFAIILFIVSILLNMGFVLFNTTNEAYDQLFEELDTANLTVIVPMDQNPLYEKEMEQVAGIEYMERQSGIYSSATIKEFRGTDFSMNTVFYNMEENHTLNQSKIVEEIDEVNGIKESNKDKIYLPLYMVEFGEYKVGDDISYQLEDKKYTFQLVGEYQEMQYGNFGTGVIGVMLPEQEYHKLLEEQKANQVNIYSFKIAKDGTKDQIKKDISSILRDYKIQSLYYNLDQSTKEARTIMSKLIMVILVAFAGVVLITCLVLSKFRIVHTMQEEMASMGVLKSLGYTSKEMILSMILPYVMIVLIASILGIGASYGVLPTIIQIIELQAGYEVPISFSSVAALLTLAVLLLTVVLFTYVGARKIKRVQPVLAIRGSSMWESKKKTGLLFFVMFIMTGLIAFAGVLFYNVIIQPRNFTSTLSEELPSGIIEVKDDMDHMKEALKKETEIDTNLIYGTRKVSIQGESVDAFVCEEFKKVHNDLCYEGRNPETSTEIAVGLVIKDKYDLRIGDQVEVANENQREEYQIVGFIQSINYQGNVVELTTEGYETIDKNPITSLYLYKKKGTDMESFLKRFEAEHSDSIVNVVNYEKTTKTASDMYSQIVSILIVVILSLIFLITTFILYIITKSELVQKKQELGIYKALGYTNRQLVRMFVKESMPTIVTGVAVSVISGKLYMSYVVKMIFRVLGAAKTNIEIPFLVLFAFGLLLVGVTYMIQLLLARPIKRVSVYALIKE